MQNSSSNRLRELHDEIRKSGAPPAEYLERHFSLAEALALREGIPNDECGDPVQPITGEGIIFLEPHDYVAAGAPYNGASPFWLRREVAERLAQAEVSLRKRRPDYRLLILDGYRPQTVQRFMREVEYRRYARETGLDPDTTNDAEKDLIWRKVDAVWARPSDNPALPPPHSTGAAVDLTIADATGQPIEMGSKFDESSERILPSYYGSDSSPEAREICMNRALLNTLMSEAGFKRITHEWWHFSFGDQMWALLSTLSEGEIVRARYGEVSRLPKS